MPRKLLRSPQELLDQVRGLLSAPGAAEQHPSEPSSTDRILDAARHSFSVCGIKATTMTSIARDAGVSREWLYRQFPNRDAVVLGVTHREVTAFIEGLAARSAGLEDLDAALTDAFVYAVEWLREHALLQRVLRSEPEALTGRLLRDAEPMVATIVTVSAGYVSALGGLRMDEATIVAETLVRLVAGITVHPTGALDLHEPDQLRRYAAAIVPGVIAAATANSPATT